MRHGVASWSPVEGTSCLVGIEAQSYNSTTSLSSSGSDAGPGRDADIVERKCHVDWMAYVWPGLPQLWQAGSFRALGTAVLFAVLLDGLLWETFVRSGTTEGGWGRYGWMGLAIFWTLGVWQGARRPVDSVQLPPTHHQQDLLIQAQSEYLKGHWVETQTLLEQLIEANPSDIEDQLLLSSVFRRSRRTDMSRKQLRRLYESDEATGWRFEIERELALLDQST